MRNANNIVRGFTACVISLCLSGWSFVSSAAAATIVVTTNQDVVDSPFNTGSLCGSGGTVADLPGDDGQVSLREAVIAANNTPGQKTIKFAPSLNGATIVTTGPLFLCGGRTTLTGDINGDDTPDVTVDGTAVSIHDVITAASSHNLIKNLEVLVPPPSFYIPAGIGIGTSLGASVVDNTIAHNIVHGPIAVVAGINSTNEQSLHDVSIKHTIVRDNTAAGIVAIIYGKHNVITDLTIAHNTVSGVANSPPFNVPAILVVGGVQNSFDPHDPGAADNRLDVTIKDNLVTGNSNPGDTAGIAILGGFLSSSNNHVAAQILNNSITDNTGRGISATAGVFGGSDNHIDVTVRDNTITGNSLPGDTVGIAVLGGFASSGNHITAALRENTITDNNGNGIAVGSGGNNSSDNDVEVAIGCGYFWTSRSWCDFSRLKMRRLDTRPRRNCGSKEPGG